MAKNYTFVWLFERKFFQDENTLKIYETNENETKRMKRKHRWDMKDQVKKTPTKMLKASNQRKPTAKT